MAFTYARPDADSVDGGWANETQGTTLFSSIDETAFSDADFIISSNSPTSDVCKISLSDPAGSLGQPATVRYRYSKRGQLSSLNVQVTLLQGSTPIAQWDHFDIPEGTFVTVDQILTAPQFAAISDFTNLFFQFDASSSAYGYVSENGTTYYVAEDGMSFYVQEA